MMRQEPIRAGEKTELRARKTTRIMRATTMMMSL